MNLLKTKFFRIQQLQHLNSILQMSSLVSQSESIIVSLPLETHVETTQSQGTPIIVSSTFETSTIDTTTNLPPFVTTPLDTHPPTFDNILNQTITSLFFFRIYWSASYSYGSSSFIWWWWKRFWWNLWRYSVWYWRGGDYCPHDTHWQTIQNPESEA